MAVEELFWKYMKEYGNGFNYIEFDYKGKTYQAVSGYAIYLLNDQGEAKLLHEYASLDEMLDAADFEGPISLRQILNIIEEKDFYWG